MNDLPTDWQVVVDGNISMEECIARTEKLRYVLCKYYLYCTSKLTKWNRFITIRNNLMLVGGINEFDCYCGLSLLLSYTPISFHSLYSSSSHLSCSVLFCSILHQIIISPHLISFNTWLLNIRTDRYEELETLGFYTQSAIGKHRARDNVLTLHWDGFAFEYY